MRKFGILLTIALLLALAPAVLAGGWAVITLDNAPGDIHAGEPWTIGFTVLQHGQTPVHTVFEGQPVEPTLIARNPATGERVSAVGTPTEETGHFMLEVTFPSEGEWTWTIEPAPLLGETQFEPLTVLPAAAVAPAQQPVAAEAVAPASPTLEGGFALSSFLRWGALLVALAAAVLLVIQNRRARPEPGAEPR